MYQLDLIERVRRSNDSALALPEQKAASSRVSANVWRLGFTSLFTDISSEMVSSILPLYFVSYLQFSPFQFGILDGIYQGAAVAILSLAAGLLADRLRRQKEIAASGYGFSALSKLALLMAGSHWGLAAGALTLDRVGKGIRTAPRDAIISLSSRADNLATSFAVHRALDAGGAVLGPLVAFLLLKMVPGGFSLVMMTSFCIALIGVGLITLLVKPPLLQSSLLNVRSNSARIPLLLWRQPNFRALIVAGALLQLMTVSDGFLYLSLQRKTASPSTIFPLFAFITAAFYVLLSFPAGKLADKWGRTKVFLAGSALPALIYLVLLTNNTDNRVPFLILALLGAYYAATDGILAAMSSAVLQPDVRASGLALLNTVVSVSRFISSLLFGFLWMSRAVPPPIWIYLAGLLPALAISARILPTRRERVSGQ